MFEKQQQDAGDNAHQYQAAGDIVINYYIVAPRTENTSNVTVAGASTHPVQTTPAIVYDLAIKRVVWLLPRGYVVLSDIEFHANDSWGVVAEYFNYSGNFRGGTHYHSSYERHWIGHNENENIQCRKLQVETGDHRFVRPVLALMQDIRNCSTDAEIDETIEAYKSQGQPLCAYSANEKIYTPQAPHEYKTLQDSGVLRDTIEDLHNLSRYIASGSIDSKQAHQDARELRRNALLETHEYFGDKHPAYELVSEVSLKHRDEFDLKSLSGWANDLSETLRSSVYRNRR